MRVKFRTLPSVKDDWRAWLPETKAQVFGLYAHQLESSYAMFSVALDEAIGLRDTGMLSKSCQVLGVTPDFCSRLADPLAGLLRALAEHAKHYGTIPNTAPLDAANFLGKKEQRTAKMSDLLSRVLLTQRSQFLHKIDTLGEMVEEIDKGYRIAAEDLGNGASHHPGADWQVVDEAHFDLNTCLREAIVLLKSFLLVLPEDQIGAFQKTVRSQTRAARPSGKTSIHRRRMTPIAGQ